jgi:uncharacterized membrane protein YsdA (DUF1294 family)
MTHWGSLTAWIYLIAISVATFCAYGLDKLQARRGAWRIRESTLHVLALIGGTPGALAGQIIFRHKTRDRRFRLVFASILGLQAVLVAAFLWAR